MEMAWLAPPAVLERGVFSALPAGATIIRAGERVREIDILVEGTVDEIAGDIVVSHAEPGTLLGAERAVGQRRAAATLQARTPVVLVTVMSGDVARVAASPEVDTWLHCQVDAWRRDLDAASGVAVASPF